MFFHPMIVKPSKRKRIHDRIHEKTDRQIQGNGKRKSREGVKRNSSMRDIHAQSGSTGSSCRNGQNILRQSLLNAGLILHGKTPDLSNDEIKRTETFSKVKAAEILQWLKHNAEVRYWVVLDDLDLHNEVVDSHQVRPDSKIGLSETDVKKAEEIIGHIFTQFGEEK